MCKNNHFLISPTSCFADGNKKAFLSLSRAFFPCVSVDGEKEKNEFNFTRRRRRQWVRETMQHSGSLLRPCAPSSVCRRRRSRPLSRTLFSLWPRASEWVQKERRVEPIDRLVEGAAAPRDQYPAAAAPSTTPSPVCPYTHGPRKPTQRGRGRWGEEGGRPWHAENACRRTQQPTRARHSPTHPQPAARARAALNLGPVPVLQALMKISTFSSATAEIRRCL